MDDYNREIVRQFAAINETLTSMLKRLDWIAYTEQQKHFNKRNEYKSNCRTCNKLMRFDYLYLSEITPDELVQPTCSICIRTTE